MGRENTFSVRGLGLAAAVILSIGGNALAGPLEVVAANNQFAFDLVQQVAKTQPDKNIFLSPFSVSEVLQMVDNGAAGQTKTELQQVLHVSGMSDVSIDSTFQNLNQMMTSHSEATLTLANGLWVRAGFHLKPGFVSENRKFFLAELSEVDFNQPTAARTINRWASKQTHGKIPKLVEFPFDPNVRMILANAIYFKGDWVTPFAKEQTKPGDFHLPGGKIKSTAMMSLHHDFEYAETPDFQAVQLPYKGGLRMEVFLPAVGKTPQSLMQALGRGETWRNQIEPAFEKHPGSVVLPKFKMDFSMKLNAPLQALGLKKAFGPGADFSKLAEEPVFISEVWQKSYVEVNEEGTEAAAVTGVAVTMLAAEMPRSPFTMIVDRPFLFVIEDVGSGSILFVGMVNNPVVDDGI